MGRRTELLCAGILYAIGGCLQYLASMEFIPSIAKFAIVVFGRWIYGAGIGFAMHGGPTYLAETMPPSVRGMVVGAKEIAIVVGILCGYIAGNHFCVDGSHPNGWADVYALTMVGAMVMIAFSNTIPESARYLVCENHYYGIQQLYWMEQSGKETDFETMSTAIQERISSQVLESLRFVWHDHRAQEEHAKLMEMYSKHQHHPLHSERIPLPSQSHSLSLMLLNPSVRPALKAGLGLVILQQITGQPSVLSYATPILARVPGLGSNASVFLAIFKVVATSLSVILVEKNGRKTLLRAGCSLMLLALIVLVFAFREPSAESSSNSSKEMNDDTLDISSIFALLGMFAYIAGYQIGFGPITWLMISEVFPQSVRSTTVALAVQANFALNALVQLLVPLLQTSLGMSVTFGIFGCLTAYSLWFVQHSVPETKGLTLEEIEEKLAWMGTVDIATSQIRQDSMFLDPNDDFETNATRISNRLAAQDDERMRLLPH